MTLRNIAVHHVGSSAQNPLASAVLVTVKDIDAAQKVRWPEMKSQLGYWVGYNVVIYRDGTIIQTRLLGEETCAQTGHNLDTVSILLIGNFTKGVDTPTLQQQISLKNILIALINKNVASINLQILPGTILDMTLDRIYPHRKLAEPGHTACFGDALSDNWARDLANEYFQQRISLLQRLTELLQQLIGLIRKKDCAANDICYVVTNKGQE